MAFPHQQESVVMHYYIIHSMRCYIIHQSTTTAFYTCTNISFPASGSMANRNNDGNECPGSGSGLMVLSDIREGLLSWARSLLCVSAYKMICNDMSDAETRLLHIQHQIRLGASYHDNSFSFCSSTQKPGRFFHVLIGFLKRISEEKNRPLFLTALRHVK